MIYGVKIWLNACNVYLDPLVKLQKKCLMIVMYVTGSRTQEYTEAILFTQ